MSKEAIQKGIDALRGVIAWDIMRNNLVPYRVRDPIHEAIEALAALAEQPAPVQQEPVAKYIGECSEGSLVQLYDDVKKGTNFYTSQQPAPVNQKPYGYCPICGAEGVMRERRPNGYDKCANGHTYPSSKASHGIKEQP